VSVEHKKKNFPLSQHPFSHEVAAITGNHFYNMQRPSRKSVHPQYGLKGRSRGYVQPHGKGTSHPATIEGITNRHPFSYILGFTTRREATRFIKPQAYAS